MPTGWWCSRSSPGPRRPIELTDELGRLIAAELNPLFKIHDVVTVESLPRTASNKLMRRSLRADYLTRTESDAQKR